MLEVFAEKKGIQEAGSRSYSADEEGVLLALCRTGKKFLYFSALLV